jgi:hypothetical protein
MYSDLAQDRWKLRQKAAENRFIWMPLQIT